MKFVLACRDWVCREWVAVNDAGAHESAMKDETPAEWAGAFLDHYFKYGRFEELILNFLKFLLRLFRAT